MPFMVFNTSEVSAFFGRLRGANLNEITLSSMHGVRMHVCCNWL